MASGPSVTDSDIELVRRAREAGHIKVIAINAMYQKIDFADILYFCDFKFYKWHAIEQPDPNFIDYPAHIFSIADAELLPPHINCLKMGPAYGLSKEPDTLNNGRNSGYQCMNLAYLLGCPRIILCGFDMRPDKNGKTHCHAPHKIETPLYVYDNIIRGAFFESIAYELVKEGVEVINTSIDSAIHCFKKMPLEEIIL